MYIFGNHMCGNCHAVHVMLVIVGRLEVMKHISKLVIHGHVLEPPCFQMFPAVHMRQLSYHTCNFHVHNVRQCLTYGVGVEDIILFSCALIIISMASCPLDTRCRYSRALIPRSVMGLFPYTQSPYYHGRCRVPINLQEYWWCRCYVRMHAKSTGGSSAYAKLVNSIYTKYTWQRATYGIHLPAK